MPIAAGDVENIAVDDVVETRSIEPGPLGGFRLIELSHRVLRVSVPYLAVGSIEHNRYFRADAVALNLVMACGWKSSSVRLHKQPISGY